MPKSWILALLCLLCLLLPWTSAQASSQTESSRVRVTTVYNPPWIFPLNEHQASPGIPKQLGLLVDLFTLIANDLGLNYSINVVKDGTYGNVNSDGQGTGMIGELLRGEADIALADLTLTKSRAQVLEFGHPIMMTGISILAKRPPYYLSSNNETNGSPGPMIFYPVMSIDDLLKQDHVRYGALSNGSTLSFFKNSLSQIYSKIGDKLVAQAEDLPKTYEDARERVRQGNGQYVFFMEQPSIRYTLGTSCEYTELGLPFVTQSYGMAFPKGSKLRADIDIVLLRLIEEGTVENLINKWFPPRLECNQNKPSNAYLKAALDLVLKTYNSK